MNPSEDIYVRYLIPMYWFPSSFLIVMENITLSSTKCPKCGAKALRQVKHLTFTQSPKSLYPARRDKYVCKCEICGYLTTIEFIFREPKPDDDPVKDFEYIYTFLLEKHSSEKIINYFEFSHNILLAIEDIKINKHDILEKILQKILNDLIKYYSYVKPYRYVSEIKDLKTFNKFRLVCKLVSDLPDEEFLYIVTRIPLELRRLIEDLRRYGRSVKRRREWRWPTPY